MKVCINCGEEICRDQGIDVMVYKTAVTFCSPSCQDDMEAYMAAQDERDQKQK